MAVSARKLNYSRKRRTKFSLKERIKLLSLTQCKQCNQFYCRNMLCSCIVLKIQKKKNNFKF